MNITVVTKKPKEVIDITDRIMQELGGHSRENGVLVVFAPHTTCALTTADLDPGTDEDLLDALTRMFPAGRYRHPHDPGHVGDHILSSLIGPSLTVPVEHGRAVLGTWQRIVLVELSGPRERSVHVSFIQSDRPDAE